MNIIEDQIVATTSRDRHGERRTLSELESLLRQMPDEHEINQDHDRSKPTVGRMFNMRLAELEDGEHAIVADIEVYDEEAFQGGGGFSIGYASSRYAVNEELGDIGVVFNPRHFSREEMEPLAHLSNESFQIDVVEKKEKAAEEEAFKLLLDFLNETAVKYFLTRAGEGIFKKL